MVVPIPSQQNNLILMYFLNNCRSGTFCTQTNLVDCCSRSLTKKQIAPPRKEGRRWLHHRKGGGGSTTQKERGRNGITIQTGRGEEESGSTTLPENGVEEDAQHLPYRSQRSKGKGTTPKNGGERQHRPQGEMRENHTSPRRKGESRTSRKEEGDNVKWWSRLLLLGGAAFTLSLFGRCCCPILLWCGVAFFAWEVFSPSLLSFGWWCFGPPLSCGR